MILTNYLDNLKDNFLNKVLKTDTCWLWSGYLKNGYGEVKFRVKYKTYRIGAHRASYYYKTGILDSKVIVRHICDNPQCVNPNHLLGGIHADNVADKVSRNRQAKGINNGRYIHGKYTKEQKIINKELNKLKIKEPKLKEGYSKELILNIKEEILKGTREKDIVNLFKVSRYLISDIKRKKSFKSLN